MTSKEVAKMVGCSEQHIRAVSKKALEKGLRSIEIKGLCFSFEVVSNEFGKSYVYETVATQATPKKKRLSISKVDVKNLPKIELERAKVEDKKALVSFYKTNKSSLYAIAQAYSIVFDSKYNVMSLERKFRRWVDEFSQNGIKALEDKRGANKISKVEHELFLKSLVKTLM